MATGSLQIQNGKYFAVLNLYVNGKRKQKWIDTGVTDKKGNKKKAEEILNELRTQYTDPHEIAIKISRDMPLFTDFLQQWLKIVKPTIARATYVSYRDMINGRITRLFSEFGIRLNEVEPRHIRALQEEILSEGYTPNTAIHYHAVIRSALEYAVKNEILLNNPADRVGRPKKNSFIGSFYSSTEIKKLFDVTADDPLSGLIRLTAYYGLRRSEVLGLRWSAIDFEAGTLSINHKVTEELIDGKTVIFCADELKTKSSYRTLPLFPEVIELLQSMKAKQELFCELFGNSYNKRYLDYVCVDINGSLFRPNFVTEHFAYLIKTYGLRKIRFHDLRHSCASLLLANGVQMKQIQDWLGHSNFSTTADIYSHLDYSSKLKSAEAIRFAMCDKQEATEQKHDETTQTEEKEGYEISM